MKTFTRRIAPATLAVALAFGTVGCGDDTDTSDEVESEVEDAGSEVESEVEDAGSEMETEASEMESEMEEEMTEDEG